MERVDDDEVLLGTVHKHLFGIIIIYIQAAAGLLLSLGLGIVLVPNVFGNSSSVASLAVLLAVVVVALTGFIVLVATIIYRQSYIVITDKNITQVIQSGLFQRKISQLTMANVEDVTSEQKGIFASLFDFGTLKIETAGEQTNFNFNYCPRSSYYAKIILEAREKFISQDYPYAAAVKGEIKTETETV